MKAAEKWMRDATAFWLSRVIYSAIKCNKGLYFSVQNKPVLGLFCKLDRGLKKGADAYLCMEYMISVGSTRCRL